MDKKTLFIIILLIFFFSILFSQTANFVFANETPSEFPTIVKDYPEIPGVPKPSEASSLPEYIKYLYLFGLGIVGVSALLAIVIGAFSYVTSAGSAQQASKAKDQILSALFGILLLLSAWLLLHTINPDLTKWKINLPELSTPATTPSVKSPSPVETWYCSVFNCPNCENVHYCYQTYTFKAHSKQECENTCRKKYTYSKLRCSKIDVGSTCDSEQCKTSCANSGSSGGAH